jgi:hypothetical protein
MAIEMFCLPKGGGACNIIFEKKIKPTMPSLATNKFQSPPNGDDMLDGDGKAGLWHL